MHEEVALVEARKELGPKPRGEGEARHHQQDRQHGRRRTLPERHSESRGIRPRGLRDKGAFFLRHATRHEDRHGGGHERDGQNHGSEQGGEHGERHRVEHLSLNALKGQDRQVHDHDDELAEHEGAANLLRGLEHDGQALRRQKPSPQPALLLGETADAVLDDDDGAIDDDAEVQGPEAQQVAAHASTDHADHSKQHRQRDNERGDDRGPDVPQEQKEDHDHKGGAQGQVVADRLDGGVDQLGAVIHRLRHHTAGKSAIDFGHLRRDPLRHRTGVLTHEHEGGPDHDLTAILRRRTRAQLRTHQNLGDVADVDRGAPRAPDHDPPYVVKIRHLAGGANQVLLAATFDVARSHVRVVLRKRPQDVAERETVGDEAVRIGSHMELLHVTADAVHVGSSGQ